MLPDCFTCPYEVIQYNEHVLISQNQEIVAFSQTKIMLDLEAFNGIEEVFFQKT